MSMTTTTPPVGVSNEDIRFEILDTRSDVTALTRNVSSVNRRLDSIEHRLANDVRQIGGHVDSIERQIGELRRILSDTEADARRERDARERTRRVNRLTIVYAAALGIGALGGYYASVAEAAPPPPNAAAPLAWPTRSVEAAAHRWLDELAPDALGDGVRLVDHQWACERTKRRPARYRCEGAALWIEAGEYVETREVLSACRPSRRVTGNGATWTSARVLVRREGPKRGGMLCKRASS